MSLHPVGTSVLAIRYVSSWKFSDVLPDTLITKSGSGSLRSSLAAYPRCLVRIRFLAGAIHSTGKAGEDRAGSYVAVYRSAARVYGSLQYLLVPAIKEISARVYSANIF